MDPYIDHATEIAPAQPCLSRSVTHKGKVVEYIPELEAMEAMQDWAMGIGSINLRAYGLPYQEGFMGSLTGRLITLNTCHSSTLYTYGLLFKTVPVTTMKSVMTLGHRKQM